MKTRAILSLGIGVAVGIVGCGHPPGVCRLPPARRPEPGRPQTDRGRRGVRRRTAGGRGRPAGEGDEPGLRRVGEAILDPGFSPFAVARLTSALSAENAADTLNLAELVRDIFGNPFRPIKLDPSWLSPTVLALAGQMYEGRDFSAMPILADALQDAGCENEDILDHCRGDGPHARGCFVIDLLLGKQ